MTWRAMLIRSKLAPPFRAAEMLERPALVERICARRLPLVFINAPAGYGKTTLISQCFERWRAMGYAVAWYSADEDRFESHQFFGYFMAALSCAGLPVPYSRDAIEGGLADLDGDSAARAALVALEASEEPVRIVIDDYHLVASPHIGAFVDHLLRRLPAHASVLLASRGEGNLRLSELRVEGNLLVLDARDLRFGEEEARRLVGGAIKGSTLDRLVEKTEGWPAALQLLRMHSDSAEGAGADPNLLILKTADLAAYLAEQVIDALEPQLREFLFATSLPDRLCAGLANRLTGTDDGQDRLESLRRMNLFVTALDDQRQWFRYHPLMRDYLRIRFGREQPSVIAGLHARAARWFADEGLLREGLRHASASDDTSLVAEVLERAGGWQLIPRAGAAMLAQLGDVSIDAPARFPKLALARVYVDAQQGRTERARTLLERLKCELDAAAHHDRDLAIEIVATDIALHTYEDDGIGETLRRRLRKLAHQSAPGSANRLLLTHLQAVAEFDRGDTAGCRLLAAEALEGARICHAPHVESYALQYQGLARLTQGRREDAERDLRTALEHDLRQFGEGSTQVAASSVLLARTVMLADRREEAAALIHSARDIIGRQEGWHDTLLAYFTTAAWLHALEGRPSSAFDEIERGRRLAQVRHLGRLDAALAIAEVRLLCHQGDFAAAERRAVRLPLLPPAAEARDPSLEAGRRLAVACALLQNADSGTLGQLARDLKCNASTARSMVDQCETLLLKAAVLARLDRIDDSAEMMRAGLEIAARESLFALPIQLGPVLASGFEVAREALSIFSPAARMILADCAPSGIDVRTIPSGQPTVTAREVDILKCLADGLSSKEMARVLGIAESTVKTHRLNLYRKLEVATRSRAIAEARKLGAL